MASMGGATATRRGTGGAATVLPTTSTATTPVTFVCAVESGALEAQAVRLAASVRTWGGTYASCPIVAATPRRGLALQRETRRALDELEVTYVREHVPERYGWYKYMTKLNALALAERVATTDVIVWLDSDTLVLGDAPGFRLPDGEALAACAASSDGGTTGPGHRNERWWAAMCAALGLRLDDLPWVTTLIDRTSVRLYFNAGVFAYRRSTELRSHVQQCVRRILDAGAVPRRSGLAFVEQAALSLAAVRCRLRYTTWPEPYNYNVGEGLEQFERFESLRSAHVLHYHNSMRPDTWPELLAMLDDARPAVARWLRRYGPIHEPRLGGPRELARSAIKTYRKLRSKWYETARAQRF